MSTKKIDKFLWGLYNEAFDLESFLMLLANTPYNGRYLKAEFSDISGQLYMVGGHRLNHLGYKFVGLGQKLERKPASIQKETLKVINCYMRWRGLTEEDLRNANIEGFVVEDNPEREIAYVDANKIVHFNYAAMKGIGYSAFVFVVIHELRHIVEQGVQNKIDVKILKDKFGNLPMIVMDLEADLMTYEFMAQEYGYTHEDFVRIVYLCKRAFGDKTLRVAKFERFMGSMINTKYQELHNKKIIALPNVANFAYTGMVTFLIMTGRGLQVTEIALDPELMDRIAKAYQTACSDISLEEYTAIVTLFSVDMIEKLGDLTTLF